VTPRGAALGFTTENVGRQVRAAFEGVIAKRFPRGDEEVVVRVQYPRGAASGADLAALYLRAPGGAEVPLSEVVSLTETAGFARIRREDGQRQVSIVAEINEDVTSAVAIIESLEDTGAVRDIADRFGLTYGFSGRAADTGLALRDVRNGALIGLAAIYIILAWVFGSYAQPIVIMAIIPFGIIGAIVGHLVMGFNLTMLSLVALLGLSGILVNNSIILVSIINERREKGEDIFAAIVGGAQDRLRAVLLTSLTTIGGLLPLIFETSLQAQFMIPMAITIVFGLMVATVLVLFVIPALLGVLEDLTRLTRRRPLAPAAGE
jgi:multidrug efflux pump subunit AcrB